MTKRDKIIQAAANIEGSAVMLSEKWDCYLIGYTLLSNRLHHPGRLKDSAGRVRHDGVGTR